MVEQVGPALLESAGPTRLPAQGPTLAAEPLEREGRTVSLNLLAHQALIGLILWLLGVFQRAACGLGSESGLLRGFPCSGLSQGSVGSRPGPLGWGWRDSQGPAWAGGEKEEPSR